jgi:hypothetical protein
MEKAVWLEKKGQQIKNYFAVSWTCGAGTLAKHTRMNLFEGLIVECLIVECLIVECLIAECLIAELGPGQLPKLSCHGNSPSAANGRLCGKRVADTQQRNDISTRRAVPSEK